MLVGDLIGLGSRLGLTWIRIVNRFNGRSNGLTIINVTIV